MGSQIKDEPMLHATLCEVERGLFHVAYRIDGIWFGQHHLPRYEVGTCAMDARVRVEQRARECGYGRVMWDTAPADLPIAVSAPGQAAQLSH